MIEPKDMRNKTFTVNDEIIRSISASKSPHLDHCVVTKINNGKIYLDHSKIPIRFPNRLLIVTQLYKKWPISKANGKQLTNWEFVEECIGSYEEVLLRASELQKSDPKWQYRIWDCR